MIAVQRKEPRETGMIFFERVRILEDDGGDFLCVVWQMHMEREKVKVSKNSFLLHELVPLNNVPRCKKYM